ncbi:MAG: hypothetical protein WBB74_03720 [Gaiellaceae bacterium]
MKRTLITLAAGVTLGAAAVAAPALGSHHAAKRVITVRTGDRLSIPTLDLSCAVSGTDPDGHLTGPVLFCSRYSVGRSWNVAVSRGWIQVRNPRGHRAWQHARLP